MTEAQRDPAAACAATLWVRALQDLAERASHEIRNPLHGAVLNVEVVRARAARPGTDAAALVPFADAAAAELGRTATLTEALLTLARPLRTPLDLQTLLAPIVTLARAAAQASGGDLVVDGTSTVVLDDRLEPNAVRAVLASALTAALGPHSVRCAIVSDDADVALHIAADGSHPSLTDVRAVCERASIGLTQAPGGVTLRFPVR